MPHLKPTMTAQDIKMEHQRSATLRKIENMLHDVETQMDAIGATTLIDRFYSGKSTPELTRLKEQWILGSFAARFNKYHTTQLIWASHNPPNTKRADFSVYGLDLSFVCDIEVTSVWSKPTVKNPKGYEDFSPYPIYRDPLDPKVAHIDIDQQPKNPPYSTLKRVIKGHLRDEYPTYWLVIWDNEHGVSHPNLDELASLVRKTLETKRQRGNLPINVQHVWVFDENDPKARQVQ